MSPTNRIIRLFAIVTVLAMILAACGDDTTTDTAGTDTTGADTAETTPDPTMADTTMSDTTMSDTTTGDTTAGDGATLTDMFPEGTVRIGIANEVPYGYEGPDGEATGEAPELARAILSELGIDNIEATVVEFGSLIPGLLADQYDMIAAGMFINPERAQQVIFSDPDYCGATSFGVPEGNPMGLSDFQSITDTGATLGVLGGAVEETYAIDSGIPDGQISRLGDTASLVDALTSGRIDAFALTEVTVVAQVGELAGFEATEGFIPVIDGEEQLGCGAFAFNDQAFRDTFNDKLKQFQEEGRVLPIIEPFGFSQAAVDTAAGLTVEDLAG